MTFRNRFETKFTLVEIKKFINRINIVLYVLRILFLKKKDICTFADRCLSIRFT